MPLPPFALPASRLLDEPIDRDALAAKCEQYDREHSTYNRSLAHYREVIGVRVDRAQTQLNIDLRHELQAKLLIDLFLNPWGAKLPAWDSPDRKDGVLAITGWWAGRDGAAGLPEVSKGLAAPVIDIAAHVRPYHALCEASVRPRLGRRVGPTAASKIAYVLRITSSLRSPR